MEVAVVQPEAHSGHPVVELGWLGGMGEPAEAAKTRLRADYPVWMYGLLPVDPSIADLKDILVEVPSGAGDCLASPSIFRAQREGHNRRGLLPPEPAIYITAWTTEISFTPERRREYVLDLDTRSDFDLDPVDTGGPQGGGGKTWTVAVVCWALWRSTQAAWEFRTQSLVLDRTGRDSFCRVGTLETRWQKEHLVDDGKGGAYIAAWDRHFVRRRLRIL